MCRFHRDSILSLPYLSQNEKYLHARTYEINMILFFIPSFAEDNMLKNQIRKKLLQGSSNVIAHSCETIGMRRPPSLQVMVTP